MAFNSMITYLEGSSFVTILIFLLLSIYFIAVIWIFIYRYLHLSNWISREKESLETLFSEEATVSYGSVLRGCLKKTGTFSKEMMEACKNSSLKEATVGITILSIIASTSPFIGLFGTVVGILESFAEFENEARVSLSVIAPAISEALVATAAGIFVAIPAYSFHLLLKRKSFELMTLLQTQVDILVSKNTKE